jgi:hypothetical protein
MPQKTERVITFMKVDDYADRAGRLTRAIASLEGKVGKPVKVTNPSPRCRAAREISSVTLVGKPTIIPQKKRQIQLGGAVVSRMYMILPIDRI